MFGGRHFALPTRHATLIERLHGAALLIQTLLMSDGDTSIETVAGTMFAESLRRSFPKPQHGGIDGEIQESADPVDGWTGIGHQVLVAKFQISVRAWASRTAGTNQARPVGGQSCHVASRSEPERPQGQCGIAAVTHDMDEMSFGKNALNRRDVFAEPGSFVAITRFSLPLSIHPVEGAESFREIERLECRQPVPQLLRGEPEIRPTWGVGREGSDQTKQLGLGAYAFRRREE